MDIHSVPGVKSRDVAEAHRMDLLHQGEYGCNCMTYWIDEDRETIFCLIEATDRDAVKNMHSKAHGLVPHKIIEVSSNIVQSFLGRIYDPDDAVMENGLKVFANPGFRVLLIAETMDQTLMRSHLGTDAANTLIATFNAEVRKQLLLHNGSEVEHPGEGFLVSFASASQAVKCTLAIKDQLPEEVAQSLDLHMAINGGEPIEKSNNLFGDAIQFGHYLCSILSKERVALSAQIKELASKELVQNQKGRLYILSQADEDLLKLLYATLEEKYADQYFDLSEFSRAMAMSQTQLYRKLTTLTGHASNALLKEFRLEKAKEFMQKGIHSISQVAFDTGFSSPSYFTKCFKSRYGLLPMEYIELLQRQ
ncbi:MAG: DUF4242 domain-containing protein [Chitinophagales bacterium]